MIAQHVGARPDATLVGGVTPVCKPRTRRRAYSGPVRCQVLSNQAAPAWQLSTLLLDTHASAEHIQERPHNALAADIVLLPPPDTESGCDAADHSCVHQLSLQHYTATYATPGTCCDHQSAQAASNQTLLSHAAQLRPRHVSPVAYMQQIKACRSISELDGLLKQQSLPDTYNVRHAAAALTHMAQLMFQHDQLSPQQPPVQSRGRPQQHHHHSAPTHLWKHSHPSAMELAGRLAGKLLQDIWDRRSTLKARQVSNALWALGRMQSQGVCVSLPPHQRHQHHQQQHLCHHSQPASQQPSTDAPALQVIVSHLADWACRHSGDFRPQELSSALHGLSQLQFTPPSTMWLLQMLTAVCSSMSSMTAQGVANSMWALSHWLTAGSSARDVAPQQHEPAAGAQGGDTAVHVHTHAASSYSIPAAAGQQGVPLPTRAEQATPAPLQCSLRQLLDELWRVSTPHLPAGSCAPGPSAPCTSMPPAAWPVRTLVVVAWSCARMQVLPPSDWQSRLAAATFSHLGKLSTQDTCHLVWTVAQWHQLNKQAMAAPEPLQPALPAKVRGSSSTTATSPPAHRQRTRDVRPVGALPLSWLTRLAARASEHLVCAAVSRVNRQCPSPPSLSSQQCTVAATADRSHTAGLVTLLWAFQQLSWALSGQQRRTVLACMAQYPQSFAPRELLLFSGLELQSATRESRQDAANAAPVRPAFRNSQPLVPLVTRPPSADSPVTAQQSATGVRLQSAMLPSQHTHRRLHPRHTISPAVYRVVWFAARQLSFTQPDSRCAQHQQDRVALVDVLGCLPHFTVPRCRRIWKAVRAGLRAPGPCSFTASQASRVLHGIARTGFHIPVTDCTALLSAAVGPLVSGRDTSTTALVSAAWASVSSARHARVSWRHRKSVATSPQARKQWARVQQAALAAFQSEQPPATSSHTRHQRWRADAAAMFMWSLLDLGAPTVRSATSARKGSALPGSTHGRQFTGLVDHGVTSSRLCFRVSQRLRLRPARPSPQGQAPQSACTRLLPVTALVQWLSVCAQQARHMGPQALLLLAATATRVPHHLASKPRVRLALIRVTSSIASRLPQLASTMSSDTLSLTLARLSRLLCRLHASHTAGDQVPLQAQAAHVLALGRQMAYLVESEWESRTARVTKRQAARFRAAMQRLQVVATAR